STHTQRTEQQHSRGRQRPRCPSSKAAAAAPCSNGTCPSSSCGRQRTSWRRRKPAQGAWPAQRRAAAARPWKLRWITCGGDTPRHPRRNNKRSDHLKMSACLTASTRATASPCRRTTGIPTQTARAAALAGPLIAACISAAIGKHWRRPRWPRKLRSCCFSKPTAGILVKCSTSNSSSRCPLSRVCDRDLCFREPVLVW
ncbi:hypothetical protein JKP88DRAFT_328202, partial [Tribonema minus]